VKPSPLIAVPAVLVALGALVAARIHRAETQWLKAEVARHAPIAAASPARPRLLVWQIRERGAAVGAQVFDTLIFDESDEIGRPPAQRSEAWRARADARLREIDQSQRAPRQDEVFSVRALGGHWWLLTDTMNG